MGDADAEGEDEEVADVGDITEDIDDGNGDGEGAIEEGERGFVMCSGQALPLNLLDPRVVDWQPAILVSLLAATHVQESKFCKTWSVSG